MVVSAVECDVFSRFTKDLGERKLPGDEITSVNQKRRSKSVHFADSKGLALTSIFLFAKEHLSPPASRRKSIGYLKDNYRRRRDPANPAELLNFNSPVPYRKVLEHLGRQNVCLEMIVCYRFGIYGRIQVKNLAYEKQVSVRYTFDAWHSFEDQQANYIHGASTGETDAFLFQIKPPVTSENRKMEFAIRYRIAGGEFWDNNHGDNYRLVYFKSVERTDVPIPNELPDRNI